MEIVAANRDFVRADTEPWQLELKQAIRDPHELCQRLGLPEKLARQASESQGAFRTFCPEPFLKRMAHGDPADPLLLQVLPQAAESEYSGDESEDPLNESQFELSTGLLKKYEGRALLITTGACAIHCRYCFRRFYPYSDAPKSIEQWESALKAIEEDQQIVEVILSGGDPLTLTDSKFAELIKRLDGISHVRRLRIHTRLPIMIPSRVNRALLDSLTGLSAQVICVIHCNHAAEIDEDVAQALGRLRQAGVQLLNQTVLLRGVNDQIDVLLALSERLVDVGVIPYYLHELDPVRGTRHFKVDRDEAIELVTAMRARTSGYLVPRLVVEKPGELAKQILV